MTIAWQREEAEKRIGELLDAAMNYGPQQIEDAHGVFKIVFEKRKATLEELFSEPGPLSEDDA
jgi:hypothetical protein